MNVRIYAKRQILASRIDLIPCLEMSKTSVMGLGQDLALVLVFGCAMTNSVYVSCFSFNLTSYRFKFCDRVLGLCDLSGRKSSISPRTISKSPGSADQNFGFLLWRYYPCVGCLRAIFVR